MGSIFWLAILYSLIGYMLFMTVSVLIARRVKKGELRESQATTLAALTLLTLIVSGPLTWGMVIRNTLRFQDDSS